MVITPGEAAAFERGLERVLSTAMAELPVKALLTRAHAAHTARRAAMLSWVTPTIAVLAMAVLTVAVLTVAQLWLSLLWLYLLWLSLLWLNCGSAYGLYLLWRYLLWLYLLWLNCGSAYLLYLPGGAAA